MIFDEPKAIYLQIADYMAERILTGEWPENERVPSVRDMASDLKVNVNTVMRSFTYLQEHNIISNQRGIGYFVAIDAAKEVAKWKRIEFEESILPKVFRQANVLGFSINDFTNLYRKYLKENP